MKNEIEAIFFLSVALSLFMILTYNFIVLFFTRIDLLLDVKACSQKAVFTKKLLMHLCQDSLRKDEHHELDKDHVQLQTPTSPGKTD